MNFDLASTPTLQALATGDERRLVEDLQGRADQAVEQAAQEPEAAAAARAEEAAREKLGRLRQAERNLNRFAKEASERVAKLRATALDTLIESASEAAGKPDFKFTGELAALENRSRMASRAIERLVEHLIPLAQMVQLRSESHALIAKARALERMAHERAERVLGQLRAAVDEEVVLPVDLSKGVAGALMAYAAEFRQRAVQLSENADQLEKTFGAGAAALTESRS